jgi:repressor LexA
MKPLTERQQEILDFIERTDPPPTAREMATHFELSLGSISQHIEALRAKGYLKAGERQSRSWKVANSFREGQSAIIHIPLYGSIPAGFADQRHQEADGCVSIDASTLGKTKNPTFALRVKGDSMIEKHIMPGDVVVVEHGKEPRHGSIVAALIDGESTLKTFQVVRRKSFLKAANPKYPDLIPVEELMIQGVVVALVRQCQ